MGAAKAWCTTASRCEFAANGLGSEAVAVWVVISGALRILNGLGGHQALGLKHHVLQGPRLSMFYSEEEMSAQPAVQKLLGERACVCS